MPSDAREIPYSKLLQVLELIMKDKTSLLQKGYFSLFIAKVGWQLHLSDYRERACLLTPVYLLNTLTLQLNMMVHGLKNIVHMGDLSKNPSE